MTQHLPTLIYLLGVAEDAKVMMYGLTCMSGVVTGVLCVVYLLAIDVPDVQSAFARWIPRAFAVVALSAVLYVTLPSAQQSTLMLTTKLAVEINALDGACSSDDGRVKLQSAMASYMQAWIESRTPSNKK